MNAIELTTRRVQLCKDLKAALDVWNTMNERLARGVGGVTQAEHNLQRNKVDSLVRELESLGEEGV